MRVIAVLAAFAMVGIAGCGPSPTSSTAFGMPSGTSHRGMLPQGTQVANVAYVADIDFNAVLIYPQQGKNQQPIGEITNGISGPYGLCVDAKGNLYVSNFLSSQVQLYAKGSATPSKTYSIGITNPGALTLGQDGTLYVVSAAGVTEYENGNLTPTRTLTDFSGGAPTGVTTDAKNNLLVTYVAPTFADVRMYAPGSSTGTNLGLQGLTYPRGIALDAAGNYVVSEGPIPPPPPPPPPPPMIHRQHFLGNAQTGLVRKSVGPNINGWFIYVFAPGQTAPSRTISTTYFTGALAFDAPVQKLYNNALGFDGTVHVYDYRSGNEVNSFSTGGDVSAVAVSPSARR